MHGKPKQHDWGEANRAYLVESLAGVKQRLARHVGSKAPAAAARAATPADSAAFADTAPALDRITDVFGLSTFERDVLLLCAGMEVDPEFAAMCATAPECAGHHSPNFALALAVLPDPQWSALSPHAPLRRWRLLELGNHPVLTLAPLRIDERVLHCLSGIRQLDERLTVMLDILPEVGGIVASHHGVAEQIASLWAGADDSSQIPLVQLCGDPGECRLVVAAAASRLGLRAAGIAAELVPTNISDLESFARLWQRESALAGAAVLALEWDDSLPEGDAARQQSQAAIRLLQRLEGFVALCTREPQRIPRRNNFILDVGHADVDEQRQAWGHALGPAAAGVAPTLDAIAAQFNLGIPAISAIASHALSRCSTEEPKASLDATLWTLGRARLRARLEGLAQRIDTAVGWDDLVLPESQKDTLRMIAVQLRNRTQVHERWGFAERSRRGLGISALFSGPSGTGKTMAAEVLAHELKLDLFRIDLASVVSKYIGETEKNLRRLFDAAEESGAILLFDEADALFGRRGEVKDSHDRYANVEVSYLLQRMEAYRGLAVLTTNMKSALDPAFMRRLRFVVQFPFPEQAQRAEIWRRAFPSATPTEGLDAERLSLLRVAGGNIRHIAMNAAFLAADEGAPVGMRHLEAAARSEYAKLERPLTRSESEAWA
ncbi:hypothetical protein XI09_05270 [Bradyrhizobium sp. CCBAU 11386]|uniref:ATP-binding protein n=1 Tax=Bradyrhizobium sp. CCBAU 11386 TaxID=1630837 RepID=UPI002304CF0A|nr:AAA family ATPase [Bradyrhizobium sp. CCBAU 11386]MDA9504182.1 hypothetical protein [Bradyrhizobium sp. CCBAU 11386]